ncbi:unnamed protein product [Cercospora beticola]|nr:unnamed protein product [Cercospora beticola]
MSSTSTKNNVSSSPEQGTPMAAKPSLKSIEPPTGIARLMADHSDDENDPMTMGQIGLQGGVWDNFDKEDDDAARNSSPTPSKALDEHEDFEIIGDEELPDDNDPAYVHDQHVRAMMNHRVPPYPIPSQYATPAGDREDQIARYHIFLEECYPGSRLTRENAMDRALNSAPRHGSPNRCLRIIHIKGETLEVHKDDWVPCDRTCPARKKKFLEKLKAAPGKILGMR